MQMERNRRRNASRELLTVAELQRYLNLGRTKTYELIASRELSTVYATHPDSLSKSIHPASECRGGD